MAGGTGRAVSAGEPFSSFLARAESSYRSEPSPAPEAARPPQPLEKVEKTEKPAPVEAKPLEAQADGSPRAEAPNAPRKAEPPVAKEAEAAKEGARPKEDSPLNSLAPKSAKDTSKATAQLAAAKPAATKAEAPKAGEASPASKGPKAPSPAKPEAAEPKAASGDLLKGGQAKLVKKEGEAEKSQLENKKEKGRAGKAGSDGSEGERLAAGREAPGAAAQGLPLAGLRQVDAAKAKSGSQGQEKEGAEVAALRPKKKGDAPEVLLTDLRTKEGLKQKALAGAKPADAAVEGKDAAKKGEGAKAELNLDLGNPAALKAESGGREAGEAARGPAPSSRNFSELLAERLRGSWNSDIVQGAHIILKDGDEGTIRLHLKPESLGGVKIELKLADNSISGKIVVESDEAKSAFERNMASLNDAFRQGGFESAKLEVSVGSGNGGAGQQGKEPEPFWSERRRLESFDRAVPESQGYAAAGRRAGAVDILA